MANRWRIVVELTWDIEPGDVEVKHPGDAEVDFGRRGLARVRPDLNRMLANGGFAHYHIIKMPERCVD
ncbi:hypothetical protein LCGC14_2185540 [marine sediment metagenome]|uniref:Uncharacterized protein n=1 Tax=marine sediment metagenome TaxID=412755 RepID=A0A0F9DL26_9ZZZZ